MEEEEESAAGGSARDFSATGARRERRGKEEEKTLGERREGAKGDGLLGVSFGQLNPNGCVLSGIPENRLTSLPSTDPSASCFFLTVFEHPRRISAAEGGGGRGDTE